MSGVTFFSLVLVALLLSSVSAQGKISSCCLKATNTQVRRDFLKEYYVQRPPSCFKHVVVFTTIKNVRICANPKSIWTLTSMAFLDGKNWLQSQNTTMKTTKSS
ncbi:C-C motif chemokine 2 [Oryzias melastigma]|uniref:C-C motif chemokine 2 n=1 Tax=Oryzias melastigma TaxID=30732 RepID=A0A3B3DVJ0_ORYME|nr:C-C motif chemokine 2-like [Oryzias melastigma]KAF6727606.1 C-C motif chemokine 2 [Oryzias melastigma]